MEDITPQDRLSESDERESHPLHDLSESQKKVFPKKIIIIPVTIISIFILSYYLCVRFDIMNHVKTGKLGSYLSTSTNKEETMDFITFADVVEEFKRNSHLGNILVVKGKVLNNSPSTISSVRLLGQTYNKNEEIIEEQWVYCGITLKDKELEELKPKEIQSILRSRNGNKLKNLKIPPKSSNLFTLVFTKVKKEVDVYLIKPLDYEKKAID